MTDPGDNLGEALRQALSAAVSQVEPPDDGLDLIRAGIGGRAPRPWVLSAAAAAADRLRHWVWSGHWAWQDPAYWRPRALRQRAVTGFPRAMGASPAAGGDAGRGRGTGPVRTRWARVGAGFAAAGFVIALSLSVPPLRQALVQVSTTVLTGARTSQQGGADGASGRADGGRMSVYGSRSIGSTSLASQDVSAPDGVTQPGATASLACPSHRATGAGGDRGPRLPIPSAAQASAAAAATPPTLSSSLAPAPSALASSAPGCPSPSPASTTGTVDTVDTPGAGSTQGMLTPAPASPWVMSSPRAAGPSATPTPTPTPTMPGTATATAGTPAGIYSSGTPTTPAPTASATATSPVNGVDDSGTGNSSGTDNSSGTPATQGTGSPRASPSPSPAAGAATSARSG